MTSLSSPQMKIKLLLLQIQLLNLEIQYAVEAEAAAEAEAEAVEAAAAAAPVEAVEAVEPEPNYLTIQQAVNLFMETQNVHTKLQLDDWCDDRGRGRKPLYTYVKERAPIHWDILTDPRAGVRGYYETKLVGYKIYKH
jgi:hypothetical protein